jgi:radical SAM superfamily enzyme YgiQ (UPF0313 family)
MNRERILLLVLPLWEPLIPPMGISSLKSFLRRYGYNVKTEDANTREELREPFDRYFDNLKKLVPGKKRGNFYNIVNEVIHNHMMAHLNHEGETAYIRLVKIIISKTFFCHLDDEALRQLNEIIDEYYKRLETYIPRLLEEEKPAVLGISVYSTTFPSSLFAFQMAKKKHPTLKTVMGGGIFSNQLSIGSPNLEFFWEKAGDYIDRLIVGEGEMLFLKYLEGELPESRRILTLQDLDGEVPDLSSLDKPDFSDFDLSHYNYLAAYGARSCPLNCSFCSETVIWGKYRKKNPRQLADELIKLYETYGKQLFLICDSLLNSLVTNLSMELLEKDVSIYWGGYLRADKEVCDPEKAQLWRQGGFYRARLGLESGSQRILDLMGKKITPNQIIKAVSSLASYGIKTTTYWIIGYPGETEADFLQTLDLIEKLQDNIYEADCNPFKYFLSGQVHSEKWRETQKSTLLYPQEAKDLLITQTWTLDCEPSRQETYERLNRFVRHCKKLGIPNPYSMYDIHNADLRWKKLHKNAVPSMLEFKDKGRISESKNTMRLLPVKNLHQDEGDFDF